MVFWKLKYAYCRSDSVEENFEGDSQKLRQVRKWCIEWLSCLEKWNTHIGEVVMSGKVLREILKN